MTQMSRLGSTSGAITRELRKTIRRPSGDHAGLASAKELLVSRRFPLPLAFIVQSSAARFSPRMKAIFLPLGEYTASPSAALFLVRRFSFLPLAFMV